MSDKNLNTQHHEDTPQESLPVENKLELHSMSRKERRAMRREIYLEYTRNMSFQKKAAYFLEYYKWYIIIPVLCIAFVCYLGITIYRNSRPTALSYAILNIENEEAIDKSFQKDYAAYFNIPDSYQFNASTSLNIDYDYFKLHSDYITTSNSTDYSILSNECEYGDYDVIISNAAGIKYCSTENIINPLKGYFNADDYSALEKHMADFPDKYDTLKAFAIDISDTDFAKRLNTGYDDVYIAFPGKTESNIANSIQLLEYIYNIHLSEQ